MSSFKPDVMVGGQGFRPSTILGALLESVPQVETGASEEGAGLAAYGAGIDFGTDSTSGGEAIAVHDNWTVEKVEALEQAAFQRGEESGTAQAQKSTVDLVRTCEMMEAAATELAHVASTSIAANRELLIDLAIEIAEKWVGGELRLEPTRFAGALDRAIESCDARSGATLLLNPADYELLLDAEPSRVAAWEEERSIKLVVDPSTELGMFRVEAPGQVIDGSTEAIRDRLKEALSLALDADVGESDE